MKRINIQDVDWQGRFSYQKSILFTESDLNAKGSKIQVIKLQVGEEIKPHYHKIRTEVFLILKGNGQITIGDETGEAKENDFILCAPNTIHAFKNIGTEELIIAVFRTNDTGDSDMLWAKD